MLTTPHVLTGAALGVATGNPIAGFAAGVVSHFILDAIPHTDPGTWRMDEPYPFKPVAGEWAIGIVDLFVAFYLLLFLAGEAPLVAAAPIAGVVGAMVPDVLGLSPLFWPRLATFPIVQRYLAFNKRLQWTVRPNRIGLGLVTQLVVVGGAVWYLLGS